MNSLLRYRFLNGRKGVAVMATYLVHADIPNKIAEISLQGFGPPESAQLTKIGQFELDADANSAQLENPQDVNEGGDHVFITRAKELLRDAGASEAQLKGFKFKDRATNAVDTDYDVGAMSTDDIDATEGPLTDSEASTHPGGEVNSQTGEHRAGAQQQEGKTEHTAPTDATTGDQAKRDAEAAEKQKKADAEKAEADKKAANKTK